MKGSELAHIHNNFETYNSLKIFSTQTCFVEYTC